MRWLLIAGLLFCKAGAVLGQAFPAKPIKVIIPFVAGGSSDIVGRAIASKYQEYLGQPAVVENRPGANGSIAAEFVAKADPDGYTILVGSIGVFSINAALFKDLRYDPVRDFAPITLAVTTPNVLVTKPELAAKSRHPQLANVPTTGEAGFPDLVVTSWQAVAAPAKTPREVVRRLNEATVRALRSPEMRERMTQIGFDVVAGTPEEFGAFMKAEVERWTQVVKRGGIQPE